MHVHVNCGDGEAKFWLRPTIEPARTEGLSLTQIKQIGKIIERRRDEIENAWKKYFLG